MPLEETIPEIDVGNFHDQNGDGWVCQRVNPGTTRVHGGESWTVKDNTNPLRFAPPPPPPGPPLGATAG